MRLLSRQQKATKRSMKKQRYKFLSGSRFGTKDAYYFLKYFSRLMNSDPSGQRLAKAVSTDLSEGNWTIIELGSGHGALLSGMRRALHPLSPSLVCVDANEHLLRKAPAGMEKVLSDISSYEGHHQTAGIIFAPCLLEAIGDSSSTNRLLHRALNLADKGFIAISVHNGPEYFRRFSAGSPSTFPFGSRIAMIRTLSRFRSLFNIEWSVTRKDGTREYSRQYTIRPKPYDYWVQRLRSQRRIKTVKIIEDDNEAGKFRKWMIGYF